MKNWDDKYFDTHSFTIKGLLEDIEKRDKKIAELVEWVRYEIEEAGADDRKDDAHNARGVELLNKHRIGE